MKKATKQSKGNTSSGFTMAELLVAVAVSGIVLASMVGTFMTFAKGAKSIQAYTDMSRDSRYILEYFARDMRAAENVTTATPTLLTVEYPTTDFYEGGSVTYQYYVDDQEEVKLLFRIEKDSSDVVVRHEELLEGVEQFAFSYFDPLGNSLSHDTASILLSIKSVQVDAEMVRKVSETEATDYIISARFMMRNRPVTK